jgi:hypothetical protein
VIVADEPHEGSRLNANYRDRFGYRQERFSGPRNRRQRQNGREEATPAQPGDCVFRSAFTNCKGDEGIDAKRSRPSIGKPEIGHAKIERALLTGTDQRITSGPAAKRSHSKAEYMTASERFNDSQIPLAPRAPSELARAPTSR